MAGEWTSTVDYQEPDDRFDRIIEGLLVALLAFMPLAFGAVEAWSEEIVLALAAALSICFLLRAGFGGNVRFTWTWAYVPVIVFLLVALAQVLPLPPGLVRLVSPNTVTRKWELLGDLPMAQEVLSTINVSFYPHATKHDLRLALAVAAVFTVTLNVYRQPRQIKRLLTAITVIAAFFILLTLAQNAFGNGKIYWLVDSPHGNARSGTFVNHSHYAQFMNMSLGAVLALLLVKIHEEFSGHRVTLETFVKYLDAPGCRVIWALGAVMLLGLATIFICLSRGGVIAMLIAGSFTCLVLSLRHSLRESGWIMTLLALGAFICVLYIGFDAVYDRLATLRDITSAQGGRRQIVADISVAWTRFPILGTGLGTHEVVYPEFDRSASPRLASHAENEYAQLAEETGAVGVLAILSLVAIVWICYARAVKQADQVPIANAAYGLGFGLLAILVHSLSDFGQHVPANAMLTAIACALLIRVSRIDAADTGRPVSRGTFARRGWIAAAVVLALVWGGVLIGAGNARRAEKHWQQVLAVEDDFAERGWQGTVEEYRYLLEQATAAVDLEPDNVKYQHWLNVYRWHAISQLEDPNTGEIILPSEVIKFAEEIVFELNEARTLCPTFGATWCVLGQLERAVLGRAEEGARHIRGGVKLAPCHPTARLVAGFLEAEEGDIDVALDHLRMVVTLDQRQFREVASQLIGQFDRPDLALDIAGEDVINLLVITDVLEASETQTAMSSEVRGRIVHLLETQCSGQTAPPRALAFLARIYAGRGEVAEAIECYRRALAREYGMFQWRFHLARLYAQIGKIEDATREAKICLRLRPGHEAVVQLLEELAGEFPALVRGGSAS